MHIVVVGGGFAGVKAALELSKRQIGTITLISNEPYFLHHATLYATATGKNYAESVIPLNVIFQNHPSVEIVEDFITSINPERNLIRSKKHSYHYDKLILALGSETTYYGISGLQKHAYGIKSLEDIKRFQDHIHDEVVQQKLDKEYFVIGAGQTGVELASALNVYLTSLKTVHRLGNTTSKVTLIEAAQRVVPHLSMTASKKIAAELTKQGVGIQVNHKVQSLNDSSITINNKTFPTTTAIWTSGVMNNRFFAENAQYFPLSSNGRVNVNEYLEAFPGVYVIGDNNTVKHSGMAQPALQQATHVAKNIARHATRRPLKKYRSKSVPVGVPLGETYGYVEWFNVYAAGKTGAVLRRWIELNGYCQLVPLKIALPIWRAHSLHHVDDDL